MDSFDLSRLTDFDFEIVCKDLFSSILGKNLELFSPGRDHGVDLRYLSPGSEHVVIQCKHWSRSGRAALLRHMRNIELSKIRRSKPTRYILATTVEMTKETKDELFNLLSPFTISPSDIYSVTDIVAKLNEHPDVVRRHLRLWLSNTTVLQTILNKATLLRSTFLSSELDETLKIYAPNNSYRRATKILKESKVCIIAGIPGIGKTTLAQVLAASYVKNGYELIEISEDAEEIARSWDEAVPQFYYYDDFLGQTTLGDKLRKNEDSRLMMFIRKINRSTNKRLVLTTREYILAQARHQYARLSSPNFNVATCILDLADYTRVTRAEILYNHIYHSSIPGHVKARFANPDIYRQIIDHKNFSPRLIVHSLGIHGPTSTADTKDVIQNIRNNLADPRNIWEHIVDHELSDADVHLLYVAFTFPPRASLRRLEEAWSRYRLLLEDSDSPRIFRRSIDTLESTIIKTEQSYNTLQVSFHNPSVQDFLSEHIPRQRGVVHQLIRSMRYFEQLEHLWTLASGKIHTRHLPHPRDEALMTEIVRSSNFIEQFILQKLAGAWTENGEDEDLDQDWIRCRTTSLKIADRLGLDNVMEKVFEDLKSDWSEEIYDGDDLVLLVNTAAAIDRRVAIENRSSLVKKAISWITQDTSDWDDLRVAEQHLRDLADLAPEAALSSIQNEMFTSVQDYLVTWRDNESISADWHNLDDMLDYASEYREPHSTFPGYDAALEALLQHRNATEAEKPANDDGAGSADADEAIIVDDIMRLLKED
ncbi:nSTAND3 domain-containing NTPase [Actinophytocola sediminis]